MCGATLLRLPDFSKPFVIETDASSKGMGAVLLQDQQPIAFLSRAFSPQNVDRSIYEKELMALVMAVTKWRHYVVGHHFIIRTDQQELQWLLEQKLTIPLQHKWLTKLLGLDYEIQYRKGAENVVADALSRRMQDTDDADPILAALQVSTHKPDWMAQLEASYSGDTECQEIIRKLLVDPQTVPSYHYDAGLLRKKGRLYVGNSNDLRQQILKSLHASPLGGHSGQVACLQRIKPLFYWPHMRQDVINMVRQCEVCQRNKPEHVPYPGLLQPLPIPQHAWSHISMDFIEKLPLSDGKDTVMVVVDRLTKFAHFIALSRPFSATTVAQVFLEQIF